MDEKLQAQSPEKENPSHPEDKATGSEPFPATKGKEEP